MKKNKFVLSAAILSLLGIEASSMNQPRPPYQNRPDNIKPNMGPIGTHQGNLEKRADSIVAQITSLPQDHKTLRLLNDAWKVKQEILPKTPEIASEMLDNMQRLLDSLKPKNPETVQPQGLENNPLIAEIADFMQNASIEEARDLKRIQNNLIRLLDLSSNNPVKNVEKMKRFIEQMHDIIERMSLNRRAEILSRLNAIYRNLDKINNNSHYSAIMLNSVAGIARVISDVSLSRFNALEMLKHEVMAELSKAKAPKKVKDLCMQMLPVYASEGIVYLGNGQFGSNTFGNFTAQDIVENAELDSHRPLGY